MGRKTKTKIQPPTPGTFAIKRSARRRARQEPCGYPTLHTTIAKKEELGTREYGYHIRPGNPARLTAERKKGEPRRKHQKTGGSCRWVEDPSAHETQPAPPQLWHTSPRTPSPTAVLQAPLGPGCGGEPSPNASAGFRGTQNQKITSMRGEGKKKKKKEKKEEKAPIHVRGKLREGRREAQTMKGKQEETEGRRTNQGGGAGGPGRPRSSMQISCCSRRQSDAVRGLESNCKY